MGKRNHNGHYLLNFMCRIDLFAANTAFLHRASLRTTYEGLVNVKDQFRKKRQVFKIRFTIMPLWASHSIIYSNCTITFKM